MIVLSTNMPITGSYLFIGGLLILVVLRYTILREWWDRPITKNVDKTND